MPQRTRNTVRLLCRYIPDIGALFRDPFLQSQNPFPLQLFHNMKKTNKMLFFHFRSHMHTHTSPLFFSFVIEV